MGTTTNYKWTLPTVHSDATTWGGELNTTIGAIDSVVWNIEKVELAGIQGQLNANTLALSRAGTTSASIEFLNADVAGPNQLRWSIFCAATTEGGSNVGSDLAIEAYSDVSAPLGPALTFNRASQRVQAPKAPVGTTDIANKAYVDANAAPIGSIVMWASSTLPTNWTWCTGQAISRTGFATLFGLIGANYGSGDGSTTFNLPNLGGRFPCGWGTGPAMGVSAGETTVTLSVAQMPVHTHPDSGHAHSIPDPQHSHPIPGSAGLQSGSFPPSNVYNTAGSGAATSLASTGITGTNPTTSNIGAAGGSAGVTQPHDNMPPYIIIGFIIRCL